jgi:hypothetical protein
MFPVYQYDAVIEDAGPLTSPPGPALPEENGINTPVLVVSVLLLLLAAAVLIAVTDFDPLAAIARLTRIGAGPLKGGSS